MIDRLLRMGIHISLSSVLSAITLCILGFLVSLTKVGVAFWKPPTIIMVFVAFVVVFVLLLRKVLPFRTVPLIKNRVLSFVALCSVSLFVLIFCILPLLFALFLLEGYRKYNQPYSERELPPNASYIDLSKTEILNGFAGDRLEVLEKYLSSNKKWNVRHWKGRKVAFLRRKNKEDWEISMNMYFTEMSQQFLPTLQYRVGVYLGHDRPRDDVLHKSLKYATAGTKDFNVPMIKSASSESCPYESWLWVAGKDIGIEIFEQSKDAPRVYTQKFLNEICSEFMALKDCTRSDSILDLIVPGSYVQNQNTSFEIVDGFQPGIYEATGYANPGKKGYVYIKAFDKATGERLSEKDTMGDLEYPGWSVNSKEQFYYRFEFTVYEGDWSKQYPAILQLWFRPSDGSAEVKLAEKEMMIYGWQR